MGLAWPRGRDNPIVYKVCRVLLDFICVAGVSNVGLEGAEAGYFHAYCDPRIKSAEYGSLPASAREAGNAEPRGSTRGSVAR